MSNLQSTDNDSRSHGHGSPLWYAWFYRAYYPIWWSGTALIAGSWFGIVSPTYGWVGFGMAMAMWIGGQVLPSLAGVTTQDYVILDSHLLATRGEGYENTLERFRDGAVMMFDGVAFQLMDDEIACAVVSHTSDLDREAAWKLAGHARSVFERLSAESREFHTAVAGKTLRISILSGVDDPTELYRIVDGGMEAFPVDGDRTEANARQL